MALHQISLWMTQSLVGTVCVVGHMQSTLRKLAYMPGSLVRPAVKKALERRVQVSESETNTTEWISHVAPSTTTSWLVV